MSSRAVVIHNMVQDCAELNAAGDTNKFTGGCRLARSSMELGPGVSPKVRRLQCRSLVHRARRIGFQAWRHRTGLRSLRAKLATQPPRAASVSDRKPRSARRIRWAHPAPRLAPPTSRTSLIFATGTGTTGDACHGALSRTKTNVLWLQIV